MSITSHVIMRKLVLQGDARKKNHMLKLLTFS